jgi:hypothetical protein
MTKDSDEMIETLIGMPDSHCYEVRVSEKGVQLFEVWGQDDDLRMKRVGRFCPVLFWFAMCAVLQQARACKEPMRPLSFGSKIYRISRLWGKELLVLLWGLDSSGDALRETVVRNWFGLKREERWWLHTMAAAQGAKPGKGWRGAIALGLQLDPVQ